MIRYLLLLLLIPGLAWADVTAFRTATAEFDELSCFSNLTAHAVADVAADDDPPQSGRVESSCATYIEITDFGFTTGDVPASSTIDGITVHFQAHGGTATQIARRRLDIWLVDELGAICTPGRDNVVWPIGTEDDQTWNDDDLADTTWGCGFVAADILDVDFGIRWKKTTASGGNVLGTDLVEIRIVYTPPGGAPPRRLFFPN